MENLNIRKEEIFLNTLIQALEADNRQDISSLLRPAKVIFNETSTYYGWEKPNKYRTYIEIKVPVGVKKVIVKYKNELEKYCDEIFDDDDYQAFYAVTFGILMDSNMVKNTERATLETYTKSQVYQNLLSKVQQTDLDPIEKKYIIEACNCAINGQRLAAATMIGCATECLLEQLCNSYLTYLKNGAGTETEVSKFERDAVNAKKASARLDCFRRTVQNKETLFRSIGLENANLHFTFLDIIRQVRNESGHPTGIIVSNEDLNTIFGNYQLLIDRVHPIITRLLMINQ